MDGSTGTEKAFTTFTLDVSDSVNFTP